MIDVKYKVLYDKFMDYYKNVHINPWHEISEKQLLKIFNDLTSSMDVTNDYEFCYLMNYCIKRLSGKTDAHTMFSIKSNILPYGFKVINDDLYAYEPESLRGAKLVSVNNIPAKKVLFEIENIITYGTEGKRRAEIEKVFISEHLLFSLPFFRDADKINFEVVCKNGKTENLYYTKNQKCDFSFNDKNATYKIENNTLIYNHFSIQESCEEKINNAIDSLKKENLSGVEKIVVDLRGNSGGNSRLNKPLMDFLSQQKNKQLIALTDYRVFSGGKYALVDLMRLGAITVGEGISTPLNCYGNSKWINVDNYMFSASTAYLYPNVKKNIEITAKADFEKMFTKDLIKPDIFLPDILVEKTVDDFVNKNDVVLKKALELNTSTLKQTANERKRSF